MPEEQVRQLGIIADFDELRGHAQLRFPVFFSVSIAHCAHNQIMMVMTSSQNITYILGYEEYVSAGLPTSL